MRLYILTCRHNIYDSKNKRYDIVTVTAPERDHQPFENKEISINESDVSKDFDLAVIKLNVSLNCTPLICNIFEKFSHSSLETIKNGDTFLAMGYFEHKNQDNELLGILLTDPPIKGEFIRRYGVVKNVGKWRVRTLNPNNDENYFFEGNSGCPIFDKDKNHVLGVLTTGRSEETKNQKNQFDIGWIISIDALKYVWKSMPDKFKISLSSTQEDVNFVNLRNYLAQGKWKEANE